jgi:16S rRNA processing protein RimM
MSTGETRLPDDSNSSTEPAGSLGKSEPAFLVVGKLRRAHGVHGEMVLEVLTDFPERLRKGKQVYLGEQRQVLTIRGKRNHAEGMLIAFDGYDTPESVAAIRNQWVYVRSREVPTLDTQEYYHHQMIGLRVVSEEGRLIGSVEDILETGAHDILLVRSPTGAEVLIPTVEAFVTNIDLEQSVISVRTIPGLEPDS